MGPLTSPSGCDRCHQLSQTILSNRRTIAELEGRISILHQLRDEEDFMESLVITVGAAAAAEATLDTTIPVASPPATAQIAPVQTAAPSILAVAQPQSNTQVPQPPSGGTEDRWLQEGAKPKQPKTAF